MQTTWILAADGYRARIFEEIDEEHHLMEIEDLANPAGKAQGREVLTGAPLRRNSGKGGRFGKGGTGNRGSIHDGQPETDPLEHENEEFSKAISDFLDHAHHEHRFEKLYVIAPPKFLGLLRKNLSEEAQKLVADEIDKDISWYDRNSIEEFVRGWKH